MKKLIILITIVILDFVMLVLITAPIFTFIWGCLALVWQLVTFLWIINVDFSILTRNVTFDLVMLILINIPIFIFIWGCLTLVWQHVTFLWIINEKLLILKTECYIWLCHVDINHYTNFYLHLRLFVTSLTTCHFSMNN